MHEVRHKYWNCEFCRFYNKNKIFFVDIIDRNSKIKKSKKILLNGSI